jgi:hypothetical protein
MAGGLVVDARGEAVRMVGQIGGRRRLVEQILGSQ